MPTLSRDKTSREISAALGWELEAVRPPLHGRTLTWRNGPDAQPERRVQTRLQASRSPKSLEDVPAGDPLRKGTGAGAEDTGGEDRHRSPDHAEGVPQTHCGGPMGIEEGWKNYRPI